MTEPNWALRIRRGGKLLRGRSLNVYVAICSHAGRDGRAWPSLERLSSETGIDRRHLSALIHQIEATGLMSTTRGRGRGHTTVYRVIDDTGLNVTAEGDISSAGNVTNPMSEMSPLEGLNVTSGGDPTTKEQSKERTPPRGGVARAREEREALSNDEVDRRQPWLLLIKGGGERKARLAIIKSYNPSPALVERAAELGINAVDEDVFGKWQRHRISTNRLPLDFEAAEADFENWIRDEERFKERDAERAGTPERRSTLEDALNALSRECANG
jgi:hypothetical protein